MLKKILLALVVILVVGGGGLVAYASTKPDSFAVTRVIDIKATPQRIMLCIENFQRWRDWSPYETKDPDMERIYSGPAAGPGATYEWNGDGNDGQGRMEIIAQEPARKVSIKLNFLRPLEAENMADFTLEPQGEMTRVTWAMTGPATLTTKIMDVIFNMDRMIGADFETGLANLKDVTEG